MNMHSKAINGRTTTSKGFTLIELILVIAIISLLASIVLTSLSTAKNKAKDTAIIASVNQLRTSLEQEYLLNKSYAALLGSPNWKNSVADCESGFSGSYSSNTIAICKSIMADTMTVGGFPGALWIGPGRSGDVGKYSIMVYLPDSQKYYCIGYDEQKSTSEDGSQGTFWTSPGCWYNY